MFFNARAGILLGFSFIIVAVAFCLLPTNKIEKNNYSPAVLSPEAQPTKIVQPTQALPEVPKNLDEALALMKNDSRIGLQACHQYAQAVSPADLASLAKMLAPKPKEETLSKEESEKRTLAIRMLGQFRREDALPILGPLIKENNQHLERCEAIKAIGELGDDESFDFLVGSIKNAAQNPQVMVALLVALERNGSSKIVPLYIDLLKRADTLSEQELKTYGSIIPQRMFIITRHRIPYDTTPTVESTKALGEKWQNWWDKNQSGFVTTRKQSRD